MVVEDKVLETPGATRKPLSFFLKNDPKMSLIELLMTSDLLFMCGEFFPLMGTVRASYPWVIL